MGRLVTSSAYIVENFLTLEQLASSSGVSASDLQDMIAEGCLPGPAYEVTCHYKIQSIFGECDEMEQRAYYPKSHIQKAQSVASSKQSYAEQRQMLQQAFFSDYKKTLKAQKAAEFGLARLFDAAGQIAGIEADKLLAEEWRHFLDGTYGLCTRSATAQDIATKETMVAKITYLSSQLDEELKPHLLDELKHAVEALDAVTAPFAPHEVKRSSRGRFIDEVRRKYLSG